MSKRREAKHACSAALRICQPQPESESLPEESYATRGPTQELSATMRTEAEKFVKSLAPRESQSAAVASAFQPPMQTVNPGRLSKGPLVAAFAAKIQKTGILTQEGRP